MRNTKTRFRLRIAFVLISFFCALSGDGTVTVYRAPVSIVGVAEAKEVQVYQKAVSVSPRASQGLPSQFQKDAATRVCSKKFSGGALSVCYRDILAIAWTESRFDNEAVGDHGKSFGAFQIYTNVHKHVTQEQANDFEWAATWTLDRLISQGYMEYRTWALGSHNSMTPEVNARYSKMVKEKSAEFERTGL